MSNLREMDLTDEEAFKPITPSHVSKDMSFTYFIMVMFVFIIVVVMTSLFTPTHTGLAKPIVSSSLTPIVDSFKQGAYTIQESSGGKTTRS